MGGISGSIPTREEFQDERGYQHAKKRSEKAFADFRENANKHNVKVKKGVSPSTKYNP